ncbi:hypothetical protein [Glutamicibacter sp. NPDC087583]|uniref:hypothetical protein n=1 Tax=Glutamicibacter sp. NPDC087583 TaxID=3363995 RepID=UPI00380B4D20
MGGDSGLVAEDPQEVGGVFFELAVVYAFAEYFEDEVSGMAINPGRAGLIGYIVIVGVACCGLFKDRGEFFDVFGASLEDSEEFVRVLTDFEERQC